MNWTIEEEQRVLKLRQEGKTYSEIGHITGRSLVSIKHKIRRLQQNSNQDRYKHTTEKWEQIQDFLPDRKLSILETHGGWGGLTEKYASSNATITTIEKKQDRCINLEKIPHTTVICGDSEEYIHKLIYDRKVYDIIDIDPYGFPSRYFPHIFKLINNGILFLTFPMMGVAQINKITIEHYRVFWGIELSDKENYIDIISDKLIDYGFMVKRRVSILNYKRIDRIYRFVIEVKKESMLKLVGLEVNR